MGRWVTTKKGKRWYIPDEGEKNPFEGPDTSDAYKKNWSKDDALKSMRDWYKSGEHDISLMKKDGRYSVARNSDEVKHAEKYGWEYAQGEVTREDRDYVAGRIERNKKRDENPVRINPNYRSKSTAELAGIDLKNLSGDELDEFRRVVRSRSDGMALQARAIEESNRRFFAKSKRKTNRGK